MVSVEIESQHLKRIEHSPVLELNFFEPDESYVKFPGGAFVNMSLFLENVSNGGNLHHSD